MICDYFQHEILDIFWTIFSEATIFLYIFSSSYLCSFSKTLIKIVPLTFSTTKAMHIIFIMLFLERGSKEISPYLAKTHSTSSAIVSIFSMWIYSHNTHCFLISSLIWAKNLILYPMHLNIPMNKTISQAYNNRFELVVLNHI